MDVAMLIIRVVVGLLFVGHGTQKLLGWFGGHGIEGTAGFLGALGYRPPRAHAVLAGLAETGAGVLLALGLATPLATAAIVGMMVNAIASVHGTKGLWVSEGGYEYNVVLIVAALAPALAGAGDWSLDAAIGWDVAGPAWGLGALLLGLLGAGVALAMREPAAATVGAEADLHEVEQQPERRAA